MSQNATILAHLRKGPITALEAIAKYKILRLAARIEQLRDTYTIHTETVHENGKRFARYHLIGDNNA